MIHNIIEESSEPVDQSCLYVHSAKMGLLDYKVEQKYEGQNKAKNVQGNMIFFFSTMKK